MIALGNAVGVERIAPAARTAALRYVVDGVDSMQWHRIVAQFSDASIHQTASWGESRWGMERLSRLVVYDGDDVVAAAQLVLIYVPILNAGVAHCKFGPMWHPRGQEPRLDCYRYILNAMHEEYVERRGLLLRIKPWELAAGNEDRRRCREEAGLSLRVGSEPYWTFVIDMSRSLEELHAGMTSKWRYNLRRSDKSDLEIRRGTDSAAAQCFMQVYSEMRGIKSYVENSEVEILPQLTEDLPERLRPTIFTAVTNGRPSASIVISKIGDVAYYLFGATGQVGRDARASYALLWEAIRSLKELDCRWLDLVGARPKESHEGGYRTFKAGLTGKNGDEFAMHDWQACNAVRSRIAVTGGDWMRTRMLGLRIRTNALRRSP